MLKSILIYAKETILDTSLKTGMSVEVFCPSNKLDTT